MNKIAFLITAYKQRDLVSQNINRIRLYDKLRNSSICVVSTFSDPFYFNSINDPFNGVWVLPFWDAPGNPVTTSEFPKDDSERDFRSKYLPGRILLSIQRGLNFLSSADYVVHLHSDSYWSDETYLINEINNLEGKLFSGELAPTDAVGAIPPGTHFHPESLIFNVKECFNVGYNNFYRIWNSGFRSHNPYGTEQLIGQFAEYCLTGNNILNSEYVLSDLYKEKVRIRGVRPYHGEFSNGFVNLPGVQ